MLLNKPQKTMLLCTCFIAGVGAYLLNLIIFFAVISIVLIAVLAYKKIFSPKFSALCLLIIIFSLFYCSLRSPQPDELYKIAPANVYLKGRVITEPDLSKLNRTKFQFQVYSYRFEKKWKSVKAKTIVNIYDKAKNTLKSKNHRHKITKQPCIGDVLEIKGYVKTPFAATNPGQFDYKNYLKNQGIFTLTSVDDNNFKIIEHPKFGKWFFIQKSNEIKNKIIDENRKYIKSPKLEILEGMVFGDFAVPAPDEIKQQFIKSGLLHLLAASGMNVSFILGFWLFFAIKFKVPHKPQIITGIILVAFYACLTGFPPSVTRAVYMMEFLLLGKLFDRKADTIILLVIVCALMLLIDPFSLANVSFQLSFITTFGILLCVQPILEKIKADCEQRLKGEGDEPSTVMPFKASNQVTLIEAVSGVVIVPLIAQIWASPIQLFHFNNFSVYSVLANILVIPFVGVITFLGFIGSIFSFVPVLGTKLCWLLDKIAEPFIDIVLYISKSVSNLPHALYYIVTPEIAAIMIFYGLIIALLFAIKRDFSSKKLNITVLALSLSLLVFIFKDNFDRKLEFVYFDVGQGDATLIHTPNNKYILVDTGPNGSFIPAKAAVIPYLRKKGVNNLDALILTHPDSDHIGGAKEILENINVNNLFDNGAENNSKTYRKLKKYTLQRHIKDKILSDGQTINLDKTVDIKVIRPSKSNKKYHLKYHNEDCIILYITYKRFSALLMADCEAGSLYDIEKYVKKPVNIIKIGHHGSYKSVDYDYLDYLKPELAVISVGKRGYKYGHPNGKILEELKEFNVKTLRTDKDHAVTVNSDGQSYIYETFASKQ